MSLYNMLHGFNQFAPEAIAMLGANSKLIGRLRDAYFTKLDGAPVILVLTRTGGGNRDDYITENDYLRGLPGFIKDIDSPMDETYAEFYFSVPPDYLGPVNLLLEKTGIPPTPKEKFDATLRQQ